jgi:acetylornithine deacetylase
MDVLEERVLAAVDVEGMLAYLSELIAVPSVTGQEMAAQEHVAAQMRQIGLEVDLWELDFETLRQHPAYCSEVDRSRDLGLVGILGGDAGRSLILNGHVDVVPAGDETLWSFPPWQGSLSDGRIYGRGALDMKGGLCCALFAAKAIIDAGVTLRGKLLIQSVIGEEDGGAGTLAAVLRGYRADGAVVMEPTQMMIAPAQAGALNFRVTVPGQAAHGAMRREGVSAIDNFLLLYQALLAFEQSRNARLAHPLFEAYELPYAISVGTVQAGEWASNVPDSLSFSGRFGVAVGEDVDEARRAFEETIAMTAAGDPWLRKHRPRVSWWGGQFAPAAIPADHPLVGALARAYKDIAGQPATVRGMPYGADMRLLVNEGQTPTVLFGPGDVRQAHRPDESVAVEDLVAVTRTLALTALRFCGVEGEPVPSTMATDVAELVVESGRPGESLSPEGEGAAVPGDGPAVGEGADPDGAAGPGEVVTVDGEEHSGPDESLNAYEAGGQEVAQQTLKEDDEPA